MRIFFCGKSFIKGTVNVALLGVDFPTFGIPRLTGVASENGKNRTLSLCRGWHPAVQRRNGHAEVLGHVLGRYATGQQLFG